jgi:hypothetical protein
MARIYIIGHINPKDGVPSGMITGLSLFNHLSKLVGLYLRRQEMCITEIINLPCHEAWTSPC